MFFIYILTPLLCFRQSWQISLFFKQVRIWLHEHSVFKSYLPLVLKRHIIVRLWASLRLGLVTTIEVVIIHKLRWVSWSELLFLRVLRWLLQFWRLLINLGWTFLHLIISWTLSWLIEGISMIRVFKIRIIIIIYYHNFIWIISGILLFWSRFNYARLFRVINILVFSSCWVIGMSMVHLLRWSTMYVLLIIKLLIMVTKFIGIYPKVGHVRLAGRWQDIVIPILFYSINILAFHGILACLTQIIFSYMPILSRNPFLLCHL